jgi:ribose transport system ATP-binding protein
MYMRENVIEMFKINKSFSGVKVLFDVDLELKREVLGLVGKNGAGKSTLMKILFGVEKADSGILRILEEEFDPSKPVKGQNRNIAMIFQEFSLIPTLTVAENIFLYNLQKNRFGLLDKESCRREAQEVLQSLHVKIDPDIRINELSVAEKQSVEIAKALSEQKKILIMDEPTAALSSDQINFLFEIIRKLKVQEIAIVYISHNLRQIFEICDRIMVIKDGRNVFNSETANTDMESVIRGITGVEQYRVRTQIDGKIGKIPIKKKLAPLLEIRNLHYGGKVRDVNFSLYPGEILGIAGVTGSGRTEILESIYGIHRTFTGKIFIKGEEFKKPNPKRALQKGLILIPDERQVKGLVLGHSVMHNMILPILYVLRKLFFLNIGKSRAISKDLVGKLNIVTAGIDQRVMSLSGGNQQKIVLSKAISTDSNILLLDDPILGIDVESKQEIANIIKNYVASGQNAAILVSSELEMISDLCHRILIVRDGIVVNELEKNGSGELSEAKLLSLV